MKRGAIDHPKMMMLAAELDRIRASQPSLSAPSGISGRLMAVGIMESLWQWCAKYAIQGDIGKWPNQVICQGIGYNWDADELIGVLLKCGLLDKNRKHRLVIHDVQDHADNNWREYLDRAGLTWFDGSPARSGTSGRPRKPLKTSTDRPSSVGSVDVVSPEPKPEPKPIPEPEPEPQPLPEPKPSADPPPAQPPPTPPASTPANSGDGKVPVSGSEFGAAPSGQPVGPLTAGIGSGLPGAGVLGQTLGLQLNLVAGAPGSEARKQFEADVRDLATIARHIVAGNLGPPDVAKDQALAKVKEVANSPSVKNRMAVFKAWVQQRLKASGHDWQEQAL